MTEPLENQLLSHRAAGDIIRTLCDRKGFDDWFYDINREYQQEIRDAIAQRVFDAIAEANTQP